MTGINKLIRWTVVLLGAAVMLYPILWMVSSSLKPTEMIFKNPGLIPLRVTLEHYSAGWKGTAGVSFTTFYGNSFIMVFFAVIGNAISCALTAFAFARLEFRYKNLLFACMMLTLMIPLHVLIIPQYIIFNKLQWLNSLLPIIIPKFFGMDAFFIFLMVQFIRGIPRELDEAATIDGCNTFHLFARIIQPLMVPATITTVIFTFMWTWNDFFSQMLYLSSVSKYTVTLALRMFLDAEETTVGPFFAMSSVSIVPIFVVFLFFQKYLVEGIATTGLKS
jgi:multiple sugar transport system permease protein